MKFLNIKTIRSRKKKDEAFEKYFLLIDDNLIIFKIFPIILWDLLIVILIRKFSLVNSET